MLKKLGQLFNAPKANFKSQIARSNILQEKCEVCQSDLNLLFSGFQAEVRENCLNIRLKKKARRT